MVDGAALARERGAVVVAVAEGEGGRGERVRGAGRAGLPERSGEEIVEGGGGGGAVEGKGRRREAGWQIGEGDVFPDFFHGRGRGSRRKKKKPRDEFS